MEYDTLASDDVAFSDQDEAIDYEDLETTIQHSHSGANPKQRIEWAQRLLISSRVLSIVHIVLNVRLIIFAWTMYNMLGRFFIMLPLAIEAIFSLLFVAIGTLFTLPHLHHPIICIILHRFCFELTHFVLSVAHKSRNTA